MVDKEKVKNYFMVLSSVESSECERFLPIIENAISYVLSILKKDKVTEENLSRVEGLCGAVAYYRYALSEFGKYDDRVNLQNLSFSGDVMKKINSAKTLQKEHFKACSDLIDNKTAIFEKVDINV